jgi:hypothetical protein
MKTSNFLIMMTIFMSLGPLNQVQAQTDPLLTTKCKKMVELSLGDKVPNPSESPFYKIQKELVFDELSSETRPEMREVIQNKYFSLVSADDRLLSKRCDTISDYFEIRSKIKKEVESLKKLQQGSLDCSLNATEESYLNDGTGLLKIVDLQEKMKDKLQKIKKLNGLLDIEDPTFGKSNDPKKIAVKIEKRKQELQKLSSELEELRSNPSQNPGRLEYLENYGLRSKLNKIKRLENNLKEFQDARPSFLPTTVDLTQLKFEEEFVDSF